MANTFAHLAVERLARSFFRHHRAYFGRPELLTCEHDEQLYWLARQLAHEGRALLGESN